MERRAWVERIAVALIGCLLLPFVWQIELLRYFAFGLAVVGLLGILVFAVRRLRRRDPYDLEALREVHERATVQTLLEEEPIPDSDTVVCRNCGASYAATIGVCPECGLIAGH